ncbi:MAG: HAD family hydrolase [Clostridia bacterium]|nr:HAD family hydrolase [Clostridia bacterium]
MKPIKLLIFDLDGTLADTIDGITEGLNRVMAAEGYPLHTRESVLGFVNYGVRQYIEEAVPAEVRGDYDTVTRLMGEYNKHYADTYTMTVAFEGITDLLDSLKDRCLLAMNSNKQDKFVKVLGKQLFPEGLFIAAEGFRDDRPAKPDPGMAYAIMEIASQKLGETLTPDQCVYIGDSDIDFYTAQNAGMRCVSVSWGYRPYKFLRALGDQPVARTQEELVAILKDMGI